MNNAQSITKEEFIKFESILTGNNIAHLATISPEGIPHSVPVWFLYDFDQGILKINTYENSRKDKNIKENENIYVSICSTVNPYNYVQVSGKVLNREIDIGGQFANLLTQKYSNNVQKIYPSDKSRNLLIYNIVPLKIAGWEEKSANAFLNWLTDAA